MYNRLNKYFKKNLEDLNKITDNNFSFLDDRDDVYYLKEILKAFYSNHLQAFVNAYLLLYKHKNYYVCKAIERILLSLYIKIRMLEISDNPEKVAENFCSDGKKLKTINEQEEKFVILEEKIKLKPKDICSDTRLKSTCESGLCNYFDLLDKDSGKENRWKDKYRELSKYIHPTNASAYSYLVDKENISDTLVEGDFMEFENMFNSIIISLNNLLRKIGAK